MGTSAKHRRSAARPLVRPIGRCLGGAAVAVLAGLGGMNGLSGTTAAVASPAAAAADAPLAPPAPAVAWHAASTVSGPDDQQRFLNPWELLADATGATTALYGLYGTVELDGPGSTTVTSARTDAVDLLVVRRSPAGAIRWWRRITGLAGVAAMAVRADGGVVVAADVLGEVVLDTGATYPPPDPSFDGSFLLALGDDGAPAWGRRLDAEFIDVRVDVHPTGGVLLSGTATRGSELGRAAAVPDNPDEPWFQVVSRLGDGGALTWARAITGTERSHARWTSTGDVAVMVGGWGNASPVVIHVPGDPWTLAAEPGSPLAALAVLDGGGGRRFAVQASGALTWGFSDLAPTPDGGLVVAGTGFEPGTMSWGGRNVTVAAASQRFLLRLDGAGALRWSAGFGVADDNDPREPFVAVGPDGSVVAVSGMRDRQGGDVAITTPTGSARLPTAPITTTVVVAFAPDGALRWADSTPIGLHTPIAVAQPGGGLGPVLLGAAPAGTAVGHDPARVVPASTVVHAYGTTPAPAPCAPDLVATLTPPTATILAGEQFDAEVTVTNRSSACTAEDARVAVTLPENWWATTYDFDDGYDGGNWWLNRLGPGATRRLRLAVTAFGLAPSGSVTVAATAAAWFRQGDAVPGDNRAAIAVTVAACQPDLRVAVAITPGTVAVGERATATLLVTNAGNCSAFDSVTIRFPAGTPVETFTEQAAGGGYWSPFTSEIEQLWSDTIPAGATRTATLPVAFTGPVTAPVTVSAELGVSHGYPDPGPNSATTTVTVRPPEPAAFAGTVTGPDGPAAGVSVLVSRLPGSLWDTAASAVTDAQGRYRIEGLAPGGYKVRTIDFAGRYENAWVGNLAVDGATVQLAPSGGTGTVDITVATRPTGGIVGDAFGRDGKPLAGLWVELFDSYMRSVAVTSTDANGVYLFGSLRDGAYRVLLWDTTGGYPARFQSGWPSDDGSTFILVTNGEVQLVRTNFT